MLVPSIKEWVGLKGHPDEERRGESAKNADSAVFFGRYEPGANAA